MPSNHHGKTAALWKRRCRLGHPLPRPREISSVCQSNFALRRAPQQQQQLQLLVVTYTPTGDHIGQSIVPQINWNSLKQLIKLYPREIFQLDDAVDGIPHAILTDDAIPVPLNIVGIVLFTLISPVGCHLRIFSPCHAVKNQRQVS